MNITELKAFVAALTEDQTDTLREHIEDGDYNLKKKPHLNLAGHDITLVDYKMECDGEDRTEQVVFKVDDSLYALYGRYDSYEGSQWGELSEIYPVTAVTKTITVYEHTK